MPEFNGLWKHQNNPACTESVRVFRVLKLNTTGWFSEAGLHTSRPISEEALLHTVYNNGSSTKNCKAVQMPPLLQLQKLPGILFYNLVIIYSQCVLLWHIHGEKEREREDEFAFVYNICLCTWLSVHTCVWCRSMRVNVFVKL